ncbi:MAG: M15 family metallopeptidase [Coriobacteriales bacterium]|nr:M15 family metallopeptidase [Coriobacteriales bacterium]
MTYTKRIAAAAISAALVLAPLAGCGASGSQPDAKQEQGTEQKQATIDYMALVNKQNKLPDGWEEALDLVEEKSLLYEDPVKVERKAYEAYQALKEDLAKDGVSVELDSCYRSVAHQQEVMDEFTKEKGAEYAQTHVATPGYSEHHTGLALDLFLVIDGEKVYENDEMMKYPEVWEKVHAKLADHGFILRYLEGKDDITGYAYEPWHIRYIDNPEVAHKIMDQGLTFEEYLGVAEEAKAANAKDEAAKKADYEVDYGTSEVYTHDDIDAAVKAVMAEFGTWKGCTMKKVAYTNDQTCKDNLEYANSLRKEGTPEFTQAMVLTSDFHSPSAEEAQGTAWEPDTDYKDYTWTLGRTDGGEWQLLTWGYA